MNARIGQLVAVALAASAVTLAAPAVGHGIEHALFAHNSHRVDGKHAVGAGSSARQRAGKLVATDADGHLPNGIIEKAPDAAELGGVAASAYMTSAFTPFQVTMINAATQPAPGPFSIKCESDGATVAFTAPEDGHLAVTTGSDFTIALPMNEDGTLAPPKVTSFGTRISTWIFQGDTTGFRRYILRWTHGVGSCDGSLETLR
jgi:hypothetical protein